MKKSVLITEICLDDFLKLNLTGYQHRRHYFNAKGKEIPFEKTGETAILSDGTKHWSTYEGVYSKVTWDQVNLNDIVLENIGFSAKEDFKHRCICLALHTEPTEEEVESQTQLYNYVKSYQDKSELVHFTHQEAYEQLLYKYSYLDKWLTPQGNQTYLIRCDVPHLYVEKRKFCTHDDYFDVPKSETKVVYLIRF